MKTANEQKKGEELAGRKQEKRVKGQSDKV